MSNLSTEQLAQKAENVAFKRKIADRVSFPPSAVSNVSKKAFVQSDDEIDETEFDPKTKTAIENLARDVAERGISAENDAKSKYRNSSIYWFLYDNESLAYKYFKLLCKQYDKSSSVNDKRSETAEANISIESSSDGNKPKRRKSRWGDASSEQPPTELAHSVSTPALASSSSHLILAQQASVSQQAAASANGSEEFDEEAFKRQVLASQLAAKALAKSAQKKQPTEYDSDEDTEGGTFEHKQRTMEMLKTYNKAKELTEKAQGKHHLADFLPVEEKKKFLQLLKKSRDGEVAGPSQPKEDYAEHKLQEDNLGFKLLQKMGWSAGKGLGTTGQGIQAPINKGKAPNDNTGLGADPSAEREDDDLFDAYRKRMMMAYKFRPNPLNNPRRPYY